MPNRIWDEKLQDWVMVDEARFALQTRVVDTGGFYEGNNVEDCLQELGDKLANFDGESIKAIADIKEDVAELDERVTYIEENGVIGGGGGGAAMPTLTLLGEDHYAIPTDGEVTIYYNFTSPNVGFGTSFISLNYETVESKAISQGRNSFTVKNLSVGEHRIDIYVTDISGLYSNTITITIVAGGLELTSNFDASNDITLEDYIRIRYNIATISSVEITVTIDIDGQITNSIGALIKK